jgi:small subunit ribosomal protein S15
MALTAVEKKEIVKKFGKNEQDTGSAAVQVAILTEEISRLNKHLADNHHDFCSSRVLLVKVAQRRSLLAYIKKNNLEEYASLINALGLRR